MRKINTIPLLPRWTCEFCSERFNRNCSGSRPIRFCSQICFHEWNKRNGSNAGQFKKGMIPWSKGKKGLWSGNTTSFKKGIVPTNRVQIGTVKIRTRRRDKNPRAWVKVGWPNVWKLRAVINWESAFGKVPAGSLIHHKDRNALNDDINNLELMTRAEHLKEHRPEFERKRLMMLRKDGRQ